jgi:hypothetical protein
MIRNYRAGIAVVVVLSGLLGLLGCSSNEIGSAKDVNPEAIWFDYRVWGDEEGGNMTMKLQYRFAGPNGTTLLLEDPSKVEFDGVAIKADSSKWNGAYYEINEPIKEFAGRHTIVFTDINNKQYKEEFSFQPISLKTPVPAVVTRDDLFFELEGLAPRDYVRIMITDTAAFSEGISRIDTVVNGRITITRAQLENLKSGPVHLEFSKEDEKRVKNGTKQGGKLYVSYELKREFELRDGSY